MALEDRMAFEEIEARRKAREERHKRLRTNHSQNKPNIGYEETFSIPGAERSNLTGSDDAADAGVKGRTKKTLAGKKNLTEIAEKAFYGAAFANAAMAGASSPNALAYQMAQTVAPMLLELGSDYAISRSLADGKKPSGLSEIVKTGTDVTQMALGISNIAMAAYYITKPLIGIVAPEAVRSIDAALDPIYYGVYGGNISVPLMIGLANLNAARFEPVKGAKNLIDGAYQGIKRKVDGLKRELDKKKLTTSINYIEALAYNGFTQGLIEIFPAAIYTLPIVGAEVCSRKIENIANGTEKGENRAQAATAAKIVGILFKGLEAVELGVVGLATLYNLPIAHNLINTAIDKVSPGLAEQIEVSTNPLLAMFGKGDPILPFLYARALYTSITKTEL